MNQHAHRIGVLSSLDPASWQSDVVARVLRAQIDLHHNDVSFDLRSIRERAALSRASWQPALTAAWPTTVSTVVVEHDIKTHDRERAGAASITAIETNMFADTMLWCGLFEQTLDPAAVDTRTRMLEHLGVDSGDAGEEPVQLHDHHQIEPHQQRAGQRD